MNFSNIDTSNWATNTPVWTIDHLYMLGIILAIVLFYSRIITLHQKGEL